MSTKKYIKLPPELADGQHSTFHGIGRGFAAVDLSATLEDWLRWGDPGDTIALEIVEMTDDEFNALPEI